VVFARDLTAPWPEERDDPALRWTDLSDAMASRLAGIDPVLSSEEIRRLQREGQYCRLAWMGTQLVHCRWDTTGAAYLPYLGVWCRPRRGDVPTTWLYTARAYRGRGIQRASHADLRREALTRGCQRSIGVVAVWSAPSLRANDRTGRVRVGTVGCLVLGPWRRPFATGAVRLARDGSLTILDPEVRGGLSSPAEAAPAAHPC
jgi:GNAT superfamily N-acetyltransferase